MNTTLPKVIRNEWRREANQPCTCAKILQHDVHPEGLDMERIRFIEPGEYRLDPGQGHILSVTRGRSGLSCPQAYEKTLRLGEGCHLYIPAGMESIFQPEADTEFLHVQPVEPSQAEGKKLLLRDEQFLSACASEGRALRWILTPQYLSRRVFLHNDTTLLSKSGNRVSWFRTTMFDVAGLPNNDEGEPVFKMSYNSRTEINVCYDVKGVARVRMARHPYRSPGQAWTPWFKLDSDSNYHLNESAGGPEEECYFDAVTQTMKYLRNRHEVYIIDGYVTLFCMFDPAPTGSERHHPGEYSDYESIKYVLGTPEYEIQQKELAKYDPMVDELSLAKAKGELDSCQGTPVWDLYLQGLGHQVDIEAQLAKELIDEGNGRERVLQKWMMEFQLQ